MNNISQLIEFEKEGMGALKAQEYPKAIEFLDKSLELAGSCLRLKMARGDCLAHLGRYVPFIFVIRFLTILFSSVMLKELKWPALSCNKIKGMSEHCSCVDFVFITRITLIGP